MSAKGDKGQIGAVEHQFNRHKYHDRITTQKYAKRALHYGASVSLEEAFAHEQRAVELLREEQQRG